VNWDHLLLWFWAVKQQVCLPAIGNNSAGLPLDFGPLYCIIEIWEQNYVRIFFAIFF